MIKKVYIIIVIISFLSCDNTYKIEREAQKCLFTSFVHGGDSLKVYISDYESILKEKGILESSSKESYYDLFEKIMSKNFPSPVYEFSLKDSLDKLTLRNFVDINLECNKKIENLKGYKESVTFKIKKYLEKVNSENIQSDIATKEISGLYPKDYFELTLHKLQLLLMIDRFSKIE